jgi:hypothetical protein
VAGTTVARLQAILSADTGQFDKAMDRSDSRMRGVGKSAFSMGTALKASVAGLATGGLAVGMMKTIDAASDLGESVNAVNVVFGDASQTILDFSERAAKEAGLSMRAFNQLVTPVGASLRNTGFAADEAARASVNLAKRAADMASVFNTSVDDALGAIQAGLRGEADPLERFGVGLSDAAVKAKAMSLGLAETEKELTANDKAQARLALIMQQTNKVAGDFSNTSGSMANQQRIAKAQFENLSATLGQKLIPIINKVLEVSIQFMGWAERNWPEFQRIVETAAGDAQAAFDAVWPTIEKVGNTILWIANNIVTPVLKPLFTTVIPDAARDTRDAFNFVANAADKVRDAFVWFRDKGGAAIGTLWAVAKKPLELLGDAFGKVRDSIKAIRDGIQWLIDKIPNIPKLPDLNFPSLPFGDPRDPSLGAGAIAKLTGGDATIDRALWDELGLARAMGLSLTSGYRPGAITANGTPSDHGKFPSKAIDVAGPSALMAAFFRRLIGNSGVKQAFYDPLGSIFGGALSGYREGGHSDHVHVATYDKGGILRPGLTLAYNGTGRDEYVTKAGGVTVNVYGDVTGQDIVEKVRQGLIQIGRRNGGSALGGFA